MEIRRQEVDAVGMVLASGDYQPFGTLENVQGVFGLPFRFTGEETDSNELVHLRKRYYVPQLGIFPSLDPVEGAINRPMSLNAYTWDRANRLLSMGGISYVYNGDGNRIQQDALKYILDLQPGLAQVIGDSDGSRYVHAPRGIHAVSDGSAWTYPLTDALGSVRGYADENSAVLSNVNYSPTGVPDVAWDGWAFTGEWRSENETQYHRARHLSPVLGGWQLASAWK